MSTSAWAPNAAFQIGSITNSTLNISSIAIYSLQDALNPYSNDSSIYPIPYSEIGYMFPQACGPDPNAQNCTQFCTDPAKMFRSLETLANCMVFPTIADRYATNALSPEDQKWADQLGIQKSKTNDSLSLNITTTIHNCMYDYCYNSDTLPECKEVSKGHYQAYPEDSFLNLTSTFYYPYDQGIKFDLDLCEFLQAPVNQDIGGQGVYISYWIQNGLAVLGFFMVLLWSTWMFYLSLIALVLPCGFRKAKMKARRIQSEMRAKRLPAITAALTEFQKAQCFFMLAINIAAQVIRAKGGLEPSSLQQIYNTYSLIQTVAISGFLPITLTLFSLHMVDMVSWYLLTLSASTIAVSIATLFTIGNFNPTQDDLTFLASEASKGTFSSCGNQNPFVYCYAPPTLTQGVDIGSDILQGGINMLAFCLVIFTLVIVDHSKILKQQRTRRIMVSLLEKLKSCLSPIRLLLANRYRVFKQHPTTRRLKYFMSGKLRWWSVPSWTQGKFLAEIGPINWPKTCTTIFVAMVYMTLSGLYFFWLFVFFVYLTYFAKSQSISNSWGFGQIVAIIVWAPPLCEFIHLEMRGMRKGFQHRLLKPYTVIKDPEQEEGVVDPDTDSNGVTPLEEYASDPEKGAYEQLKSVNATDKTGQAEEDRISYLPPPRIPSPMPPFYSETDR